MTSLPERAARVATGLRWFIVTAALCPPSTPMTSNEASHSPLYLSLLAETAKIGWPELERFFARGILLRVARDLDLVSVAEAIASDDTAQVSQWLSSGLLERVQAETAADYAARDPDLWAVVVSPWVCVQERDGGIEAGPAGSAH
jgi:hypothetical protein